MDCNHIVPTAKEIKSVGKQPKALKKVVRVLQVLIEKCYERHGDELYRKTSWPKGSMTGPPKFTTKPEDEKPAYGGYKLPDNMGEDAVPTFSNQNEPLAPSSMPNAIPISTPVAKKIDTPRRQPITKS